MNRQISNFSEIRKNSELKNRSIKITQTETQRKKNEIYIREHLLRHGDVEQHGVFRGLEVMQ